MAQWVGAFLAKADNLNLIYLMVGEELTPTPQKLSSDSHTWAYLTRVVPSTHIKYMLKFKGLAQHNHQ